MPCSKVNDTRCPNLPESCLDYIANCLLECRNELHFAEKPIINSIRPV
jgi:hypothetical protein